MSKKDEAALEIEAAKNLAREYLYVRERLVLAIGLNFGFDADGLKIVDRVWRWVVTGKLPPEPKPSWEPLESQEVSESTAEFESMLGNDSGTPSVEVSPKRLDAAEIDSFLGLDEEKQISVTPEVVICLECHKRMKMLKRHLKQEHDLAPDEYLSKHGLPEDHPLVAPNYAARRSAIAKETGLGKK